MKVYRLSCARGHDFEGWFGSSEDFDRQQSRGDVRCPLCDDRTVARLPSAPYVNTGSRGGEPAPVATNAAAGAPDLASALAAIKAYVVANTENVGRRFPEVARKMHYGEESPRGIRGNVTGEEAAELQEEGIEAVALPPGLALDDPVH